MSELIPVAFICAAAIFLIHFGEPISRWIRTRRGNR